MTYGLPLEWIVAVRFLYEGRLQTVFIVVGIAIGVGVIVFMSAMLAGLENNILKLRKELEQLRKEELELREIEINNFT